MENLNVTDKISKTVALIIVGVVVGIGIALNNTKKNETTKKISEKIEQLQKETQQAIEDSLSTRGIKEEIRADQIWHAQYAIDHIIERNLGDCTLDKLCSAEEIEHMNDALFKQQQKRMLELNHVSAIKLACLNFYVDKNTTLEELSEKVVYLFGYQAERYGPLFEPIRFPDDENPFMIINKDNELFITKTNAVINNLPKEQKEKYLSAAVTMTTAQNEIKVAQNIKEYFYKQADKEIGPLIDKLLKNNPNLALEMQRKILSTRR